MHMMHIMHRVVFGLFYSQEHKTQMRTQLLVQWFVVGVVTRGYSLIAVTTGEIRWIWTLVLYKKEVLP